MSQADKDVVLRDLLVSDLNAQVSHLKEEIHSTFARHRKSLASRELWLLDQAESIKEAMLSVIIKQQVSLAEVKGRLQECVQFLLFSKDHAYVEGVERASDKVAQLQKEAQNCIQSQDSQTPVIKFLHDQSYLRNAILSYGKLETESRSDGDWCSTEQSWDFVSEKEDIECVAELRASNVKNRCCGAVKTCCTQGWEIEDMDLTDILNRCDRPQMHAFDNPTALKNVCKANELCSSISECVCDIPCLSTPSNGKEDNADPVNELSGKLCAIFACGKDDKIEIASGQLPNTPSYASFDEDQSDDLLSQISNTVNNLLSHPDMEDKRLIVLTPKKRDCIDDLQEKLQKILDGDCITESPLAITKESEKLTDTPKPVEAEIVEYKSLPWGSREEKFTDYPFDEVAALQKRLAEIYEGDSYTGGSFADTKDQDTSSAPDPVELLSKQLRQILAC